MNLPKAYSIFYAKSLLHWLRENNPAAYRRVVKDHKINIEGYGFGE